TWDSASTAHFYNGSSDVTWNNATLADNTIFGGTAGTVTVAAGGVNASNLIFNSPNYTLSGGTITMMARQTIDAASGTATIDIPNSGQSPSNGKLIINGNNRITGSGNIAKTGQGWLTLYGSNATSYSGNWIIHGGVVEIGGAQVLGSGSLTVNSGGEIATNAS